MSTPARPFGRKQPPTPIPDAKPYYHPLLKHEIARRLAVICATFLAFISSTLLISTLDFQRGPPLGVFGHAVAITIVAVSTLAIGAIPSLVLRARAVSTNGIPSPTRAGTFIALSSSPRTWRTLAYFAASGFGLTLLHVAFLNLTEWEDSRLTILSPTRRSAFRLNERFIYLSFFNASLGLIFATRDLVRYRWVTRWSRVSDDPDAVTIPTTSSYISEAVLAALKYRALLSTTIITVLHVLLFPLSYHVARMFVLPMLRNLPIMSRVMRPFLHGIGRTWTVDVPWSRMFALGFKTSMGWELVESSFDYWSVKPINISPKTQNPNLVVVAGLHSQDRYFKHHAYLELSALAASPSAASVARRTALFTDTRTTPTLWNALARELLMTLGRDYQLLLRRGKPVSVSPPSAPQPPSIPKTPKTPTTPLLRQPILKPSPRGLFDSLSSNGEAVQTPASTPSHADRINIPSVFLSSTPPPSGTAKKPVVKPTETKASPASQIARKLRAERDSAVMGILSWAEKHLPQEWRTREWWTEVSLENVAKACLPEGELDIAGIHAISHLVAASLTEDPLGAVQRDIPRVLEALLSFLGEADAYQAELESKLPPPTNNTGNFGSAQAVEISQNVARAVGVVQPVTVALRTGIGLIARTFGDRLGVYKFPPPTAQRLQEFMDHL